VSHRRHLPSRDEGAEARAAVARPTAGHPLLRLQARVGNGAVAAAVGAVQREAEDDLGDIKKEETLEGAPLALQRKSSDHALTNLTEGAVTIVRKPAADIAAAHNRPVAVGWTTPAYDIQPGDQISGQMAHFNSSVAFTMELASEYTGARGQVLRDHEQGHVRIGMLRARRHLDRELHDALAALTRPYTRTAVKGAVDAAASAFSTGEGTDSKTYDDSDYPRMLRAYLGARSSMETIGGATPTLQKLIDSMRSFNMQPAARIGAASTALVAAKDACAQNDIDTAQYNPEFAGVVTAAIRHAAQVEPGAPADAASSLDAAQQALELLRFSSQRAVRTAIGL
jgi:hypothetical protein